MMPLLTSPTVAWAVYVSIDEHLGFNTGIFRAGFNTHQQGSCGTTPGSHLYRNVEWGKFFLENHKS